MAKDLDDHVKNVLNERYQIVLQSLRDNSIAIEEMTAELLEVEVITGERVREIIIKNGGIVFKDEDLHSEAIKTKENNESIIENISNDSEETDKNI
jgi:cell division protease FtsH